MALFDVPKRAGRSSDNVIVKKSKTSKPATTTIKGGGGLLGRIAEIKAMVEKNLGKFKDDYLIIQDEKTLHNYISKCIENNVISVDTETTGLDPILDKIVGLCIYTPNEPAAYVPINHISYVTGIKVENQLAEALIKDELQRCVDANIDIIMFNAKFDIRVLRNQIGVYMKCTWDCYLAGRLLNENEPNKGLKSLHKKYCLDGQGDAFSFDALFKGISFDYIPINVGYLYAAHDAIITYELYEYQKEYLSTNGKYCKDYGLEDIAWVFENIEMPCVEVCCDMEDMGIEFDLNYANKLSKEYNKKLIEKTDNFNKLLGMYSKEIEAYKKKNPNHKLDDPINIASPTQIAILIYDIMGCEVVDKKSPRGTGVDILKQIDEPICKAILEYREIAKLLSTYIDKLPECVNPKDGRIHCSFNQYGADTGRFSSRDPNLQNIPSHNKDIRKMFKASDGYAIVNSEFNQQESMEYFEVDKFCEVETSNGWKYADTVEIGDSLLISDGNNKLSVIVIRIDNLVDKNHKLFYYE